MTLVIPDPDALVEPAFLHMPDHVTTIGPEVADLNRLCGFPPNPEQQLLLDGTFAFDKKGRIPFEACGIASRQNLKTGYMVQKALGKAILLKRPTQIWTAHLDSATDKAHADFEKLIEASAELSKRVKKIGHGKGSKSVTFVNGCELLFRARTGKGGQSFSADDVDLDELFAVEPTHVGSFMPTMSTRWAAQIAMLSSAPHATSAYQRTVMNRGRLAALGMVAQPRMFYAEWTCLRVLGHDEDGQPIIGPPACTPIPQHQSGCVEPGCKGCDEPLECDHRLGSPGCICDDPALVKLANPSLERSAPPSISWEYVQSERSAMAEIIEQYLRERMGIGEQSATLGGAIPSAMWEARLTLEPAPSPAALGVSIDPDRIWASIGVICGDRHLAANRRDKLGPWIYEETKRIALERGLPVGIDTKGPASSLIQPLKEAGVRVIEGTTEDYILTCSEVYDGIRDGKYEHGDYGELNDAVAATGWRYIGKRRVWAPNGGDITMLEGVTWAVRASQEPEPNDEPLKPFALFGD